MSIRDPDQTPGSRRLPQSGEHVMGLQDFLYFLYFLYFMSLVGLGKVMTPFLAKSKSFVFLVVYSLDR